jgi:hypothetical protein
MCHYSCNELLYGSCFMSSRSGLFITESSENTTERRNEIRFNLVLSSSDKKLIGAIRNKTKIINIFL